MAERHVSVPKPFASGDANEWFTRYEICCKANDWKDGTPALKLPTLLEGEALAVCLELSEEQQGNYETAKKAICEAMMPMEFVSLDEFHRRKLRPGEAVSIFVHDLKKLLEQSMPGLEEAVREKLVLHQFLAGLPENISKQLRATGEVLKLEAAVARTRLLMTIDDQEQSAAVSQKPSEVELLCEQVALLTEKVAALSAAPTGRSNTTFGLPRPRNRPRCFGCNRTGHVLRECPHRFQRGETRTCFTCGQPGHIARDCYQGNENGAPAMGGRRPRRQ